MARGIWYLAPDAAQHVFHALLKSAGCMQRRLLFRLQQVSGTPEEDVSRAPDAQDLPRQGVSVAHGAHRCSAVAGPMLLHNPPLLRSQLQRMGHEPQSAASRADHTPQDFSRLL